MSRNHVQAVVIGCALLIGFSASAQAQPSPAPQAAIPNIDAYLGAGRLPDPVMILPPPPVKGSSQDRFDNEVYQALRATEGTPRYALAVKDVTGYLQAHECSLGLPVSAWPKSLTLLLSRVGRDAATITNLPKDHWARPRPFITNNGPMCSESDRAGLIKSPSYPSGHATYSWAVGLILAELAPERATQILARARAFGESRVVCGVHTVTDVTEGRTNGSVLVAALHSDPAFQADLAVARAELRSALSAPHVAPDEGRCKVEADAGLHTPWVNPTSGK